METSFDFDTQKKNDLKMSFIPFVHLTIKIKIIIIIKIHALILNIGTYNTI